MARKQRFKINIIRVGDRAPQVLRLLCKDIIHDELAKKGLVADNLDELLEKYITHETCYGNRDALM
ncbi:hypothetical protein PA598K_06879 [Paenibacillus sp. 598K]|nr:hypothetical protein PA598K_06879 [Paenibacillus sp. 598K]